MLIAVPGWPLPTFWTASIASTRTVSMARRSSSPKSSGRVGCGWRGSPVGASLAASAGASAAVLFVASSVVIGLSCSLGSAVQVSPGGDRRRPRRTRADGGAWPQRPASRQPRPGCSFPGRTVVVDSALPAACAAPTWSTLVVCATEETLVMPTGVRGGRGLQLVRSPVPGRKGPRAVPVPGGAVPGGALRACRLPVGGRPVTTLSERPTVQARRLSATLRAYVALTKPRIIELLLVTTLPAMMLASGGLPGWQLLLATMAGGTLAAAAANVFNCWYDRDIDRLMHRTERRPLVTGEVTPRAALVFGGVLGAAPVLIGWAAVTGTLAWPAVVFFGVVFCWQMPHFWALAMRFRADYARADVPMLPVVAGPVSVGRQTVAWTWLTVAVSLLMWPVADGFGIGWGYTAAAAALGLWFVVEAHRLLRRIRAGAETKPMQLFHVSITYMTLLSIAIIVDV